jgi:serine/threonine-protein kinase
MATVHIGRLVAQGGFARRVAIKRLHPHLAGDPEIAAGFAEEARLSARVAHVNVANIFDVVSADGELLLVMDYVHGESLARLLALSRPSGNPAPIAIVVRVLADALHGLHAAHEATAEDGTPLRLVHRDVSPQNILVGADGAARVVDFGIAKTIASAHVTGEGQVKGKMPYLAPEQLLRRAIDRRTDVYAAGVTLWEALAGRRLFAASDEPTLFGKILEEPVVPPSRVDARVPAELDAIVMRAIDRDPDRRFATAREMAVALEGTRALALTSAVADWVAENARDALARRASIIADMEREAGQDAAMAAKRVIVPTAAVVLGDAGASDDALVVPRSSRINDETTRVTLSAAARRPKRGHRTVLAAAVTVTVALACTGVGLVSFGASRRAAARRAEQTAAINVTGTASPTAADPATASAFSAAPVVSSVPPSSASQPVRPSVEKTAAAPAGAAAPTTRWCKVFDPDRQIFVMKAMRVARCP